MNPSSRGRLFIISAPSGAGKTTLREALCARQPDLAYSVSHTTRRPRQGEQDGVDYNFTSREDFVRGIKEDRWAEWAEVHENYYGTSARFISRCLDQGCFTLLDIDVQGTEKILNRFPEAVTIFIMPPSMEILEQRLTGRGTDAPEMIAKRLENARGEMDKRSIYKHILVNDDLETAVRELEGLVLEYGAPPPCPEAERRPLKAEILYGMHPVREALLAQKRKFQAVYIAETRTGEGKEEILALARERGVEIKTPDQSFFKGQDRGGQGVAARVSLFKPTALESLVKKAGGQQPLFFLLLDEINDPQNCGALIRTALCAGRHRSDHAGKAVVAAESSGFQSLGGRPGAHARGESRQSGPVHAISQGPGRLVFRLGRPGLQHSMGGGPDRPRRRCCRERGQGAEAPGKKGMRPTGFHSPIRPPGVVKRFSCRRAFHVRSHAPAHHVS